MIQSAVYSSEYLERFSSPLRTPLGNSFARMVTMGKELQVIPKPQCRGAFLSQHTYNRWGFFHSLDQLAVSTENENSHINVFHEEMSRRFLNCGVEHKRFKFKSFPTRFEDNSIDDVFVKGHVTKFKTKVMFPSIFIACQSENKKIEEFGAPIIAKWWLPIEYVFFLHTLKEYRDSCGLLKIWQPYSNLVVGVIPAGDDVIGQFGIASRQFFPNPFLDPWRNDRLTERLVKLGLTLKEINSSKIQEVAKGGTIQFYFDFVKFGKIYDIGKVIDIPTGISFDSSRYNDNSVFNPGSLSPPLLERENYLRNEIYDQSKIRLVDALCEAGILSLAEKEDLYEVVESFKIVEK